MSESKLFDEGPSCLRTTSATLVCNKVFFLQSWSNIPGKQSLRVSAQEEIFWISEQHSKFWKQWGNCHTEPFFKNIFTGSLSFIFGSCHTELMFLGIILLSIVQNQFLRITHGAPTDFSVSKCNATYRGHQLTFCSEH